MESLGASIFLHNTLVGQDYMSVLLQHSANPQREDHAERRIGELQNESGYAIIRD
jgi:hypothetical protein